MKYKCILFDFDGTLAHSDDALFCTFNETLGIHGHEPISRKEFSGFAGKKMRELYSHYSDSNETLAQEMRSTHLIFQKKHLHRYILFPKTVETLAELKKKGLILGMVTTANKIKMNELMKLLGLSGYFRVCITPDDVKNIKPHRDPFDKALSLLNFSPSETLMVGDTDADIEGARCAGIDSVAVTYSTFGMRVKEYNPTYTIDKIEELLEIVE